MKVDVLLNNDLRHVLELTYIIHVQCMYSVVSLIDQLNLAWLTKALGKF